LASWLSTRHRRLVPLSGTAQEVARIGALSGDSATVCVGPDFTEGAVRELAGSHRYVHFATHGVLDDGDPAFCGLVLSPPGKDAQPGDDSFLQVYEIPALGITAEVVVCSACQTGLGAFRVGEGLVGLAQALLAGGARMVVLSLWPVPDVTTIRFMTAFCGSLRAGEPVASALRNARAELRQRHPDPYYWAPFVGVGTPWPIQQ
jgi:CHAT domain-containing protein